MTKIKFEHLSVSLKVAAVMAWVVGTYLGIAFLIGFAQGLWLI